MGAGVQTNLSRQLSLAQAMQAIIHCGPISRASIAKQTGLSKQTVSEVVRLLEEAGWVRETGRTQGHVGRTATTYELVTDGALMAAVDLGGTKVRAAIVDLAGTVLAERVELTHSAGGGEVARQIAALARRAAAESGLDLARVRLAVVGCPGVPDPASGAVYFAPNIPGLDRIDFRARVAKALGVSVTLENDVNLAAIGEHWLGAGQGVDHLAFIALGTGIGAGFLVGGEILRGARGAAGELGYLPFGADPFEPESRRAGALERVVATQGIRDAYEARTGRRPEVPAIFDAAATGDADAREVIEETARTLARAVAAVAAVANPELVLLGGSIGSRPEVVEATRREVERIFPFPVRVEASRLGHHAALSGAVAIGLTELHTALFAQPAPGAAITLPIPKGDLVRRLAR
jgi:predicted NBD/HSP70 family sugar kinase/biotin operon repressor